MSRANALRLAARVRRRAGGVPSRARAASRSAARWWFNLGLLHKARGRVGRGARRPTQRARALLGDEKAVLWNLAIAATALGRGEDAAEALRKLGHRRAGRGERHAVRRWACRRVQVRAASVRLRARHGGRALPDRSVGLRAALGHADQPVPRRRVERVAARRVGRLRRRRALGRRSRSASASTTASRCRASRCSRCCAAATSAASASSRCSRARATSPRSAQALPHEARAVHPPRARRDAVRALRQRRAHAQAPHEPPAGAPPRVRQAGRAGRRRPARRSGARSTPRCARSRRSSWSCPACSRRSATRRRPARRTRCGAAWSAPG